MYYIGIDLGGTNIAAGLVDEQGNIARQKSIPTMKERGIEIICDDMVRLCNELMDEMNLSKEDIHSVGVGTPGYIDSKNGIIIYANNIVIKNFEIVRVMGEKLGLPVYVGNDADCAALGEVTSGIAKDVENALILTLGTGVGGGIIINGKIFSGGFPGGGELGHQVVEKDGRQCSCGRKGCFEKYASASALISDAKEAAKNNPESLLYKMVDGNLDNMNAKIPFDAAQEDDDVAIKVIDNYLDYLALGIANLINVFKPEMIIIGGGVSKQEDNLINPVVEKVSKELYSGDFRTQIKTAKLGNDAGIIGAAMLGK